MSSCSHPAGCTRDALPGWPACGFHTAALTGGRVRVHLAPGITHDGRVMAVTTRRVLVNLDEGMGPLTVNPLDVEVLP